MGTERPLSAHLGIEGRCAAFRSARRPSLPYRRNSFGYRAQQDSEGYDRQDEDDGGIPLALRPRLGLPRVADRDSGRKRAGRQDNESRRCGISQDVSQVCRRLRGEPQARIQAARRFRPMGQTLPHDGPALRSFHCRRIHRFSREGLRLSRPQACLLVHLRPHGARGSRSRVRRSQQHLDLDALPRG